MHPFRTAAAVTLLALLCRVAPAGESGPPAGMAGLPLIAGHFRLTAPDGSTVDSDALAGRPYGLFFGFTHCPDICPTTLADLSIALERLPAAVDLRVYFVSVDPERDTPAVLARYMTAFDKRIVALSGDGAAVAEAVAGFGAVARRTELQGGGYTYSHTAAILLIDGDGLIADRVGAEAGTDGLAARLAALADAQQPAP